MSADCHRVYQQTEANGFLVGAKLQAAAELYLATGEKAYLDFIFSQQEFITKGISRCGWYLARIAKQLEGRKDKQSRQFVKAFRNALTAYRTDLQKISAETPYGVPYRPSIWGAGWDIQRFGFEYYFLANAIPTSSTRESSIMPSTSCSVVIPAATTRRSPRVWERSQQRWPMV